MPKSLTPISWVFISILLCYSIHVSAQWEYLGSPESSYALNFDAEGDTLLAVTTAGLFFSDNDASSWQSITTPENIYMFHRINIEQGSLYLTVYAPIFLEEDIINKYEIWRSDDWGTTWHLITGAIPPTTSLRNLLISNDTIYYIGLEEMYVSFDKGNTFPVNHAVQSDDPYSLFLHNGDLYALSNRIFTNNYLLRSDDLGFSWSNVYGTGSSLESIFSVTSVGDELWKIEYTITDTFFMVSSSTDHGMSWVDKDSFPIPEPNLLDYYVMGNDDHLFLVQSNRLSQFYASDDEGFTWQQQEIEHPSYNPFYANGLLLLANESGIQISHDQGHSFTKSTDGVTGATVLKIAHSGSTIWANANEFMHKSEAGNPQWTELDDLKNISNTLDGHLIATIQDIPHYSSDHGLNWIPIPPGAFDNPFYYAGAGYKAIGNIMYCTTWGDSSFYSLDYGVSWDPIVSDHWTNDANVKMYYQGGKYLALDNLTRFWSSDNGIHWDQVEIQLSEPVLGLETFHYFAPYYFTTSDTFILRTHEDDLDWELILPIVSGNTIPIHTDITSYNMVNHGNLLLSTFYGYGVFASVDHGASWYAINSGLTNFQTASLTIIGPDLYLGVDGGVWRRPLSDIAPVLHEGIVFNDVNQNGLKDTGETGVYGAPVKKTNQNVLTYSDIQGGFYVYSDSDEPDFIEAFSPSIHATVTTSPIEVTGSEDSLYFGIYYTPGIYDAVVTLTNTSVVRPGFENDFVITYHNAGTEITDMEIRVVLPGVLEIISSTLPYTMIEDTIVWFVTDIIPGVSGNITLTTSLHPFTPNGSILEIVAHIPPGPNGDYNLVDNVDTLSVVVVSSYDPNDKAVYPSGYISPAMIADTQRLEYTIRFQNTGTYLATFIRIQDTISTNLDLSSIQILSASHPFTWKLLQGRVLEFFFDDINLPDSTSDERGSHGFVKFAINANPTLVLNDQIENKAYIYFDYNVPVVTNTVGSTVGFETSIKEPGKSLLMYASPNPTKDIIQVTFGDLIIAGKVSLSLYNSKGVLVKTQTSDVPDNISMDIQNMPSGIYLLQARTSEGTGVVKVVKN